MRAGVVSAVAVLTILAGCTAQEPGSEATSSTAAPGPATSRAPTASAWPTDVVVLPTESGVVDEDTGETYEPVDPPRWDAASRAAAERAATDVMTAFARTDRGPEAWWEGVEPHLTRRAAHDYSSVDPVNVPVGEVSGAARIVTDRSPSVAVVRVPTDVGPYLVTVVREADDAWLADRLTPGEE